MAAFEGEATKGSCVVYAFQARDAWIEDNDIRYLSRMGGRVVYPRHLAREKFPPDVGRPFQSISIFRRARASVFPLGPIQGNPVYRSTDFPDVMANAPGRGRGTRKFFAGTDARSVPRTEVFCHAE